MNRIVTRQQGVKFDRPFVFSNFQIATDSDEYIKFHCDVNNKRDMLHRALDVNLMYPTVKVGDQTLLRYSAKFVNKAAGLSL